MIHIACAFDRGYLPHCAAMLHSLLTHNAASGLCVHVLHGDDLAPADLDQLAALVQGFGAEFAPLRVEPALCRQFAPNARFPLPTWYRILLPELLPALPKVLYLDCDIIVTGDLGPLWRVNVDDHCVGAVTNPFYSWHRLEWIIELGLPRISDYFNSGVLLMNLEALRRERWVARVNAFLQEFKGRSFYADQEVFNALLHRRRLPLAPRWNMQNQLFEVRAHRLPFTVDDVRDGRRNPVVIHFIGEWKPWNRRCYHRYKHLYWKHLAQTPWAGLPMEGRTWQNFIWQWIPLEHSHRVEIVAGPLRALLRLFVPDRRKAAR